MKSEKKKPLKRINRVILKHFLLLSALLIFLLEFICLIIVADTTRTTAKERLFRVGGDAAALIASGGDADGFIRDHRRGGIIVYVLSASGEVLLPSDETSWNGDMAEIVEAIGSDGAPVIYSKNTVLKYVEALDFQGGSYLVATYPLEIYNSVQLPMLGYFIIVGVAVLLLSAMIAYVVSQKLSSGLKNLSATAVRFSEGDFSVDFANAEYQELADLSDTLNSVRDEVKKSGDFQRELIANVSHDFKTPLTMIKAYASMIREISGDNPEKRDKHLQVIIDETDRLTGIVNDMLNVSKLSSNLDEIKFKVFNLTEFLYSILNKFNYLQETQGYTFLVDVEPNLYTRADEEKIGQVIYNLLSNAVNYTGEDKRVYISLKSNLTAERIKLTVRDTGKGIAKEDLKNIWNRYYRIKETHARPVKGTGIGLNIVKLILQSHAFDFGVESEKGKGSEFWVDFPAVPAEIEEKNK